MAVVLIRSLSGFDYSSASNVEFMIFRQVINFAFAIFVFMAGYFVNIETLSEKFSYKN